MIVGLRAHGYGPAEPVLGEPQGVALLAREHLRDRRVSGDHDRVALDAILLAADLAQHLVTDRALGEELPGPVAVEARLVQGPSQALTSPLAGHLDQAELTDPHGGRLRLVVLERLLQGPVDLVAI